MLFAAPAFAQSIDITSTPGPDGAAIEVQITQVVTARPQKAFRVGLNALRHGTFTVASHLVPVTIFAIGDAEEPDAGAPLRQLLDLIALPSTTIQIGGKEAVLPRVRLDAPSQPGVGLTPREVRDLQTQIRRDADAALAKLRS